MCSATAARCDRSAVRAAGLVGGAADGTGVCGTGGGGPVCPVESPGHLAIVGIALSPRLARWDQPGMLARR